MLLHIANLETVKYNIVITASLNETMATCV